MLPTTDATDTTAARFKKAKHETLKRALTQMGIPALFLDVAPDDRFDVALLKGKNIWLYGSVGTGKTHAACAIVKAHVEKHMYLLEDCLWMCHRDVFFTTVPDMLASWRESYTKGNTSEDDALKPLLKRKIVVLDDLGKGQMSPWATERIYRIANTRYTQGLATIITSQELPGELAAKIAEKTDKNTALAIVSRLRHNCTMIELEGADRRLHG